MRSGADSGQRIDFSRTTDDELVSGAGALLGSERELTARFVAHLAEIEERRLHLEAGFSSLFEFCVEHLRLSEGEAYRRILAARLVRRFPVVYEALACGAVHLSALELLRDHLTDENHAELLDAATGKSKRQIQMLLAKRFPRPDVAASIRRLPEPLALRPSSGEAASGTPAPPPPRGRIEPLAKARFKVEFTASAALRDKLELCRDLMSHSNPDRELGVVIERAVDLLLADLERQRLGKAKRPPSRSRPRVASTDSASLHVPRDVRRQVFERDGLRCSFVSRDGRRCTATAFLELDHVEPRACGGTHTLQNVRVFCRAHNQHSAEQVFGRETVERRRADRQQRSDMHTRQRQRTCERPVSIAIDEGDPLPTSSPSPSSAPARALGLHEWETLQAALRKLGFRDGQTRAVIAPLQHKFEGSDVPALGDVLREAVLLATASPPPHRAEATGPTF